MVSTISSISNLYSEVMAVVNLLMSAGIDPHSFFGIFLTGLFAACNCGNGPLLETLASSSVLTARYFIDSVCVCELFLDLLFPLLAESLAVFLIGLLACFLSRF